MSLQGAHQTYCRTEKTTFLFMERSFSLLLLLERSQNDKFPAVYKQVGGGIKITRLLPHTMGITGERDGIVCCSYIT